jgi:hypothetical protein
MDVPFLVRSDEDKSTLFGYDSARIFLVQTRFPATGA